MRVENPQKLYERLQKLRWVALPSPFVHLTLRLRFEPLMREELEEAYRLHFPRRKRVRLGDLPPTLVEHVQEKYLRAAEAYLRRKVEGYIRLRGKFEKLVREAELHPLGEVRRVLESSTSDFHSQGLGAPRYAIEYLEARARLLGEAGFHAEVRTVEEEWRRDAYGHPYLHAKYELWANAAPWQLAVLEARHGVSYLGVNSQVYSPWGEAPG